MHKDIDGKSFEALLALYNHEIDRLKEKLLNGESWENLYPNRQNITELAVALHQSHNNIVADKLPSKNPAEFPQ